MEMSRKVQSKNTQKLKRNDESILNAIEERLVKGMKLDLAIANLDDGAKIAYSNGFVEEAPAAVKK